MSVSSSIIVKTRLGSMVVQVFEKLANLNGASSCEATYRVTFFTVCSFTWNLITSPKYSSFSSIPPRMTISSLSRRHASV